MCYSYSLNHLPFHGRRQSVLTLLLTLSLFGIDISAQTAFKEASPYLPSELPVYADSVKKPLFDRSLGQQIAFFEDLEIYVASHLTYPETAWDYSIEGTVTLLLVISPEGKITKTKVMDSPGYGCAEAALELVRNMPLWTPASNYGVSVESKQILQLNFKLR